MQPAGVFTLYNIQMWRRGEASLAYLLHLNLLDYHFHL